MKLRLLLLSMLLFACSRDNETAQGQAPPPPPHVTPQPQDATERVDMALMHDHHLANEGRVKYQRSPLPPLPALADDAAFLRRACIDLAGRLPRADEVRRFLADTAPDKRARLTDALTREPGAAEVRYLMLAEAFRVTDADPEVIAWLRHASIEDRPYAEVVTYMIGEGHMSRRDGGNTLRTAVEAAYSVLGKDMHCAMCHDDPFSDQIQRSTYEFAACFAGKDGMRLPQVYLYNNGKPGEPVQPILPRLNRGYRPEIRSDSEMLHQVAQWITEEDGGKSHALVAALRVWKSLFGMPGSMLDRTIGGGTDAAPWNDLHLRPLLVSASSDLPRNCFGSSPRGRATWIDLEINSPADLSQAPKVLIEEFLRCGSRIGEFQRLLARTHAYGRSGHAPSLAWDGCYLVPAPQIRRLPTEVIWKALSGEESSQLAEVPPPGHALRMLGRGTREWTDESATPVSHELARFMMANAAKDPGHALANKSDDLFLALLGRAPSSAEQALITQSAATSQDVRWALLNTKEFMFRP